MSRLPEVIERMATDPEFAQHARSNPAEVAQSYDLTPDEVDQLLTLADGDAGAGPTTLDERISRSGMGSGLTGLIGSPKDENDEPHRWIGPG